MVTSVTELNVSHNKLQAIPLECAFPALAFNRLFSFKFLLPNRYANMRSLKVFEVIENPWAMIPEEAIRQNLQIMYMFRVADTTQAGKLILRGFNISSGGLFALRVALPSVCDLRDINLEENKITDFPTCDPKRYFDLSPLKSCASIWAQSLCAGTFQLQLSCKPSTSAATLWRCFQAGWTHGVLAAFRVSRPLPIC